MEEVYQENYKFLIINIIFYNGVIVASEKGALFMTKIALFTRQFNDAEEEKISKGD